VEGRRGGVGGGGKGKVEGGERRRAQGKMEDKYGKLFVPPGGWVWEHELTNGKQRFYQELMCGVSQRSCTQSSTGPQARTVAARHA
jgi:hypothetical protein